MPYSQQLCVKYRLGEKKLLRETAEMAVWVLPLLEMTAKEVVLRTDHYPYKKYREYIEASILPLVSRSASSANASIKLRQNSKTN